MSRAALHFFLSGIDTEQVQPIAQLDLTENRVLKKSGVTELREVPDFGELMGRRTKLQK
jgi:hypothetical protein